MKGLCTHCGVGYREEGRTALRRVDWRSPCLPKGGRCVGRASSDQIRGSRRDLEISELKKWIHDFIKQGIQPNEMAVLVRQDVIISLLTKEIGHPDVVIMTMHEAKGSEFRVVAVVCLDHNILPDERRFLAAKDESQLDEVMTTERHLLYVAATRARDYLWMSGVEPVSEFLNDLMPT